MFFSRAALSILLVGCAPSAPNIDVSLGGPEDTGIVEPEVPDNPTGELPMLCELLLDDAICVNEVQAKNDSTIQQDPGVFSDWIELRNDGSTTVAMDRISVQVGDSEFHRLEGQPLEPGDLVLLWADGEYAPGHVPFSISSDGEVVRVIVDDRPSDEAVIPPLEGDWGFGRYGEVDTTSCKPSPGLPNEPAAPCTDLRDMVFALGAIHEFRLTIDQTNWDLLETSETFVHPKAIASMSFDGGEFPLVEVNLKGGYGSFRSDLDSQKAGFKIDLNKYDSHRWRGLKKLTLNNMVQDPTFVHEYLTYFLYRQAGLPAPRVAYAKLYVNEVYFGFYAFIETVDEPFLDLWYGNSDGHLFESAYGPDFDVGEEWSFDYDNGPDHQAGVDTILEVISTLNRPWDEATYAQLQTQVDMDQWMLNMAIESAVWHWDGYWTENNYRMYHDPATDLYTIIPHGTDQTWVDGNPNPYDSSTRPRLYDFCMNVPSCRTMYGQKLLDVADAMDGAPFEGHLDALIAITEPEFYADPRAEETGNHSSQLSSTRTRIQTVAEALRAAAQ